MKLFLPFNIRRLTIIFGVLFIFSIGNSQSGGLIDISKSGWKIWVDKDAPFLNDKLFLPPVNLTELPINIPTCGWDALYDGHGKSVTLPATVEEHFWDQFGNTYGVAGNYKGVSWFYTTIEVPSVLKGKHISIEFESVRMRAEIFVNRKLAGYDLINSTPLSFDITNELKPGEKNEICVRITDPNGNFTWIDFAPQEWGAYKTPPSHAFGGITGKVWLKATDNTFISDIYIKNRPEITKIDAEITLQNVIKKEIRGKINIALSSFTKPQEILYKQTLPVEAIRDSFTIRQLISLDKAALWSPETPNLYLLTASWEGVDGSMHTFTRRFGFRWFEIRDVGNDRQFYLNNKRIVLRTSISWGYWPVNGMIPTDEMARKQIQIAKTLGLNMLNFHRTIGQTNVLDFADEMGLLYYEEPGGYKTGVDSFTRAWNRQKLFRMIIRDRSHPSLVIYNMINESNRNPLFHELPDMLASHKLDETRIITYTSTNLFKNFYDGKTPTTPAPFKSYMEPYGKEIKDYGWWDEHHPEGPGVYKDDFYVNPRNMFRSSTNTKEIIYWGEEGAIGTPARLQMIKEEIDKTGKTGWDGGAYLNLYNAYNQFLDEKGFRKAFADVDKLTTAYGNVAMYYQGRIIENLRAGNIVDGYAVNGWESEKIENHSGIVDVYRNPKGDPKILAYYNQPLYIAVKLRNKVVKAGDVVIADFFIINEKDIKGKHNLAIKVTDKTGTILEKNIPVNVKGGNTYGQLLADSIAITTKAEGYIDVKAMLLSGKVSVAEGSDQIYAVEYDPNTFSSPVAIYDTSGSLTQVFKNMGLANFKEYKKGIPKGEKVLLIAGCPEEFSKNKLFVDNPLVEWVKNGNTVIVLTNADKMGEHLNTKEILDYRGKRQIGRDWYGGNFVVRDNPYFKGLPVNTAFNWEYQCLARYHNDRWGLRMKGEECLVAVYADHQPEFYTALGVVNCGKGRFILSTLDLEKAIKENTKSSVVAKKVLLNMLLESSK